MLRSKNLNLLPILLALLEEESVVVAADRVHLSQPAVSGALARLRLEFDDPLLVRVGRGMRRSSRAERLLPLVKQACGELELLFDFGVFNPAQSTERFVIAAPDHLSFLIVRELLPILQAEAPNVKIHFMEPPIDLPRHLAEGSIDLAVAGNFGVWDDVEFEQLFEERFVATMSVKHPLAARTAVDTSDIEPYVSVARSSYSLAPAVREPVSSGIPILDFDPSIGITRYTEAILLVIDNMMVVPAPRILVDHLAELVPVVGIPFVDDYVIGAGTFWAPFRSDAPEILWLRSLLERSVTLVDAPATRPGSVDVNG